MRELFAYRDLVRELAVTELKVKYQGSLLGYAWSLVRPLLLFSILYLVFTRVFKLGDAVPNYAGQLLLGIVLWSYFAESTAIVMVSVVDRGDVVRRASFPRIAIPVGAGAASIVGLVLNTVVLLAFFFLTGVPVRAGVLLLPLLLLELCALSLGTALILAALFVRFRDLRHLWDLFLQLLFYLTPIIYPLSFLPASLAPLAALNPLAQVIADARKIVIDPSLIGAADVLASPTALLPYGLPIVVLGVGYLVFSRAAPAFAEEL